MTHREAYNLFNKKNEGYYMQQNHMGQQWL